MRIFLVKLDDTEWDEPHSVEDEIVSSLESAGLASVVVEDITECRSPITVEDYV